MRLIDADALNVPHFHLATDKIKVLDMIDEAPTIDIDRPQGEWIEDYNGGGFKEWLDITCSLCGETLHDIQKIPKDYKYCPFCGVRMKGADDAL